MPSLNVPYLQQSEAGWCLPACARMVRVSYPSGRYSASDISPANCVRGNAARS